MLERAFVEFEPYLGGCKFYNCRHLIEPQCADPAGARGGQDRAFSPHPVWQLLHESAQTLYVERRSLFCCPRHTIDPYIREARSMEMFTVDDEVAQWESGPALAARHRTPAAAAAAGLALAPARHPARAGLASEAWRCCRRRPADLNGPPCSAHAAGARRSGLADGALEQRADRRQRGAGRAIPRLNDGAGCADSCWLLAWIAVDHGDHGAGDAGLRRRAERRARPGELLRTELAEAAIARWAVLREPQYRGGALGRPVQLRTARRPHPALADLDQRLPRH